LTGGEPVGSFDRAIDQQIRRAQIRLEPAAVAGDRALLREQVVHRCVGGRAHTVRVHVQSFEQVGGL
jgi:hypothetical protein